MSNVLTPPSFVIIHESKEKLVTEANLWIDHAQ